MLGARWVFALWVAGSSAVACRSESPGVAEMQGPGGETLVTFCKDSGPCSASGCGWALHAINLHEADVHVDAIDLADASILDVTDGQVVLRGARRASRFVVSEVWRGLPGAAWSSGDVFVQMRDHVAVEANVAVDMPVTTVDLTPAMTGWVDERWLDSRVFGRDALVAGQFKGRPGERGSVHFEASQVFVPLPDRAAPCPARKHVCPAGTVATYARNADRCAVFSQCIGPRDCPRQRPSCAPAYVLRSWPSLPRGCPDYACDAEFLPE